MAYDTREASTYIPPLPPQALSYFTQAADMGDRNAHYYLGVMHLQGLVRGEQSLLLGLQRALVRCARCAQWPGVCVQ